MGEQGMVGEAIWMETGECDPQLVDRVVAEAILVLEADGADHKALAPTLYEVVERYSSFKWILPLYGNPKQQKQLISRLVTALDRALAILDDITPEYLVELERMVELASPVEERRSRWDSPATIRKFRDASRRFLKGYDPKKGANTNIPLEEAIRSLLPLFEGATGRKAVFSQNKNKPGGPSLNSPEARAIGILLQGVDRAATPTAIVNMIEKVRRQPEESEHPLDAIIRADRLAALDVSLARGRDSPEERASFLDQ